jgi:hypothetical protein
MKYSEELRIRLKDVIINTCNKVGCKDCSLKWEGGCVAVDLENRLYDSEIQEGLLD